MKIKLSEQAEEDIHHWNTVDPAKTDRIIKLLESIEATPFSGLGKPEPLKHGLVGYWSRRINREHRLLYKVEGGIGYIVSCRYQ
jgi:toxin YoeB